MNDYDPTEGFRLLFPNSNRIPIQYSKEDTAKIKAWMNLSEEDRARNAWHNMTQVLDRFSNVFPDLVKKYEDNCP